MTLLADTSIWVDYLRFGSDGPAAQLDGFVERREIVLCGPVLAELLAGVGPSDRDRLWEVLRPLPWVELRRNDWRMVGDTAAELRRHGVTVPLTDVTIAVAAVSAGAALWSRDEDFLTIRPHLRQLEMFSP